MPNPDHERCCAMREHFANQQWVETPQGVGVISLLYSNGYALVWHPEDQDDPLGAEANPDALGRQEAWPLDRIAIYIPGQARKGNT